MIGVTRRLGTVVSKAGESDKTPELADELKALGPLAELTVWINSPRGSVLDGVGDFDAAFFGYNAPAPYGTGAAHGMGSAFFLHVKNANPTAGCVAVGAAVEWEPGLDVPTLYADIVRDFPGKPVYAVSPPGDPEVFLKLHRGFCARGIPHYRDEASAVASLAAARRYAVVRDRG